MSRTAVIAVVSIVVAVALLGGAGAGYYFAGRAQANHAVDSVNADIDHINADGSRIQAITAKQPAIPDFNSNSTAAQFEGDVKQFDSSIDQLLGEADQVDALVHGDQHVLQHAQSTVAGAKGFLTLPESSKLDHLSTRLGFEEQALAKSLELVAAFRAQMHGARALVDAIGLVVQMPDKLTASDYGGVLTLSQQAATLLTQAGTYTADAHFPAVWQTALDDLNKANTDIRDMAQALKSGDYTVARVKATAVEADGNTLSNLDTTALGQDAYLQGLGDQITALEAKANS